MPPWGVSQYAQEVSGSRQMTGSFSAKAGVVRSRMAMMERMVPQRSSLQMVARHHRVYHNVILLGRSAEMQTGVAGQRRCAGADRPGRRAPGAIADPALHGLCQQ